jgi:NTE family protein
MKLESFTQNPALQSILSDLRTHFGSDEDGRPPFIISDVVDSEGHQYVNLVQEGGGVLGIALVGYTYVLEQMGVRFLSLAGTSAGAINTVLLSSIGDKKSEKSTAILEHLANLNLFDFVDGFWFWRLMIKLTTTNKGFVRLLRMAVTGSVVSAILLALASGIVYFFSSNTDLFRVLMKLTLGFIVLVIVMLLAVRWLSKKFYQTGWGLNPGRVFRDWVSGIIRKNGIQNLEQWQERFRSKPGDLRMRSPRTEDISSLTPDVCIIASDITMQVKVEFPRMACLYWKSFTEVDPAEFVRASMSIPVFFEAAKVSNIPFDDPAMKKCWREMLSYEGQIPESALMVDGGLLSNFPINVFYNPAIAIARFPTLGIALDDEDKEPRQSFPDFGSYLWAIFNTVRYYYDRDFLIKNSIFEKCIGRIDVREFNWLNFDLKEKEKIDLFIKGAEAAASFLKTFNWEDYKNYRKELTDQIKT